MILDYCAAELREALDRVIGCDGAYDAMDMVVHLHEIYSRFACIDAETMRAAHRFRRLGCGKQRFRRDAARVETVPAHLVGFDQHSAGAHLSCPRRNRQSGRSGADNADIRCYFVAHDRLTCGSCRRRRPERKSGRSGGD